MRGKIIRSLSRFKKKLRVKKKSPLKINPEIKDHQFIFIGGLHRSGTSILHDTLEKHPSISGFANTFVPKDEGQFLQSVYPSAQMYGGPGRFAFDENSHLTECSELITADNKDKLLREWGAYFDLNSSCFMEKSPPNILKTRFFQALFPGSKFIFIVRHPIPVSMATMKWTKATFLELFFHWTVAHEILLSDISHLNTSKYIFVRYEDLVHNPLRYFKSIFEFIEVDNINIDKNIFIDHNEKYFKDWSTPDNSILNIMKYASKIMNVFGYLLTIPYIKDSFQEIK